MPYPLGSDAAGHDALDQIEMQRRQTPLGPLPPLTPEDLARIQALQRQQTGQARPPVRLAAPPAQPPVGAPAQAPVQQPLPGGPESLPWFLSTETGNFANLRPPEHLGGGQAPEAPDPVMDWLKSLPPRPGPHSPPVAPGQPGAMLGPEQWRLNPQQMSRDFDAYYRGQGGMPAGLQGGGWGQGVRDLKDTTEPYHPLNVLARQEAHKDQAFAQFMRAAGEDRQRLTQQGGQLTQLEQQRLANQGHMDVEKMKAGLIKNQAVEKFITDATATRGVPPSQPEVDNFLRLINSTREMSAEQRLGPGGGPVAPGAAGNAGAPGGRTPGQNYTSAAGAFRERASPAQTLELEKYLASPDFSHEKLVDMVAGNPALRNTPDQMAQLGTQMRRGVTGKTAPQFQNDLEKLLIREASELGLHRGEGMRAGTPATVEAGGLRVSARQTGRWPFTSTAVDIHNPRTGIIQTHPSYNVPLARYTTGYSDLIPNLSQRSDARSRERANAAGALLRELYGQ